MHDIVNFLKSAVSRTPNCGVMGCYIARDNSIFAYNGQIQAGVDMETGANFNVPATELEAALGRMQNVSGLAFDGETLTVRGGRVRAEIQCVVDESPTFPAMPTTWIACPQRLPAALALAAPFTTEQEWTSGIRLSNGWVTSISNRGGIKVEVDGLGLDEPALITRSCADFIAAQGMPADYGRTPNALFFRWLDGRWLRAQLLATKMPETVDQIFKNAGDVAPCIISPDWRGAYEDVAALSEGRVVLSPKGWRSAKGAGRAFVEIETPGLPDNHESQWRTEVLRPVMACAEAWNPAAYPAAALFIGPGFHGVVMGTR